MYSATAIAANVLLIAALSLEIWDVLGACHHSGSIEATRRSLPCLRFGWYMRWHCSRPGTWKKSAVIRWQALTLLGVVIVKVFVFDLSFLEKFYRIVSFSLLGWLCC